jgi:hypothetical protein
MNTTQQTKGSEKQLKLMHKLLKELGYGESKESKAEALAMIGNYTGHHVEHTHDLWMPELTYLINVLGHLKEQQGPDANAESAADPDAADIMATPEAEEKARFEKEAQEKF